MESKLILIPRIERISETIAAVFYEKEAARYLKISINKFRQMVQRGVIPFTRHLEGSRRIYVKGDLDDYLSRLPRSRCTIVRVEDSPRSTPKELV